jgi:hypothetical protein
MEEEEEEEEEKWNLLLAPNPQKTCVLNSDKCRQICICH